MRTMMYGLTLKRMVLNIFRVPGIIPLRKAMSVIYKMTKEFPWLNYCVSICTISDVPELYDISHVFVREAQRLHEEEQ